MRRQLVIVLLVVVAAVVVGLQVLGIVAPALGEAIRRELEADAELASTLLTPFALAVGIQGGGDRDRKRPPPPP